MSESTAGQHVSQQRLAACLLLGLGASTPKAPFDDARDLKGALAAVRGLPQWSAEDAIVVEHSAEAGEVGRLLATCKLFILHVSAHATVTQLEFAKDGKTDAMSAAQLCVLLATTRQQFGCPTIVVLSCCFTDELAAALLRDVGVSFVLG